MKRESKKLWNHNFFLLWQGQLVSAFGDALYAIALNLFVLELTGCYTESYIFFYSARQRICWNDYIINFLCGDNDNSNCKRYFSITDRLRFLL